MTAVLQTQPLDYSYSSASAPSASVASPRSYYSHKHSASQKTTSSIMTSISSTSSGIYPVSTTDTHQQITSGKLHKRSHSSQTATSQSASPPDEFYSIPPTKIKKGRIKPLLQRVGQSSGKLDLGKPDGGAGGAYYTSSSPYIGGRSSATDVTSFVPTHRQPHHKRTISGNSASSLGSTNLHPRRYVPTPNASYPNSIGDGSESSDDEDHISSLPRQSPGGLRLQTGSYPSPLSLPPTIPFSEIPTPISPMTPLARSGTFESIGISKKQKVYGGRDSSDEFAENVRAARAAFEAREQKKEEKEEKKTRMSLTRDREKVAMENNNVSSGTASPRPRWAFSRSSTPTLPVTSEKTIGIPYGTGAKAASTSHVSLSGMGMPGATDERYFHGSDHEKKGNGGLKNQWIGFVVWIKFGMVKLSRKVKKLF